MDNWDGTYALQFALPIEGEWELSAAVGGEGVPCAAAASVRAEYGPLTAEECEIENVDGMVACGTSDPIFVQVPSLHCCKEPYAMHGLNSLGAPMPEQAPYAALHPCVIKYALRHL